MRVVRGRGHDFPFPDGGNARLEALQELTGDRVSFRLVHEFTHQVVRGSSVTSLDISARFSFRGNYQPDVKGRDMGFRLAKEGQ
jgi:formylglycine-generating enzyme required for sulfatase activity